MERPPETPLGTPLRTRWTLELLLEYCDWLQVSSPGSLCHLLHRLGISYKRGRDYIHSPDPLYQEKLDYIEHLRELALTTPGERELLYLDEVTYYRQPTLAHSYEQSGPIQPRAQRSCHSDTLTRVVATLNARDAQVSYSQSSHISVDGLVRFYKRLQEVYPEATTLYIVQDNWPVHFHPDLLVALEPQEAPFAYHLPSNWPQQPSSTALKRYKGLELPIQLVPLPTYASWCNPIEKLWRKLRQELLHMHRLSNRLDELRERVMQWLDQYRGGSPDLLRYVGLLVPH